MPPSRKPKKKPVIDPLDRMLQYHKPTCAVHEYSLQENRHCSCGRNDAVKQVAEMRALIRGYVLAFDEVFRAYPLDVFPETTQEERDAVIKEHRGFIDRTSAMMGRHIAKVIQERAKYFAQEEG